MRVMLVIPPIEDFFFTPQRAYPLGLLYLGTMLARSGITVKIYNAQQSYLKKTIPLPRDFAYLKRYYTQNRSAFGLFSHYNRFGESDFAISQEIRDFAPDLIGISANFTAYLDPVFRLAAMIKKIDRRILVAAGGRAVSTGAELLLKNKNFDFIIRGEAEYSLLSLCQKIKTGAIDPIPGLGRRSGRKIILNPSALVPELDALPLPDRSLIDPGKYLFQGDMSTAIISSRGCARGCTFCAITEPFRFRRAEFVLKEIAGCYKLGIRHFNFEDDTVNLNPDFGAIVEALCQEYAGKIKVSFMNGILSLNMKKDLQQKLIRAGLTHIDLAIATSSPKLLKHKLKRKEENQRVLALAKTMAKAAIPPTVHFIVAFPDQKFSDAVKDLRLLASQALWLGPSIFYPVAESALFPEVQDRFLPLAEKYSFFRSSVAGFDRDISRDRIFTLFYLCRLINFIKQIIDIENPGPRGFRKFIREKVRLLSGVSLKPETFLSRTRLDKYAAGLLALDRVMTAKNIFRVEEFRQGEQWQYCLRQEEFVRAQDVRAVLKDLKIRSLRGKLIRL